MSQEPPRAVELRLEGAGGYPQSSRGLVFTEALEMKMPDGPPIL